jgi:hypothetical protein
LTAPPGLDSLCADNLRSDYLTKEARHVVR